MLIAHVKKMVSKGIAVKNQGEKFPKKLKIPNS